MDLIEASKSEVLHFLPKPDDAGDDCSINSSEYSPEDPSKQSLMKLTRELQLPSTTARKTSEFFDRINNLDPVKYSPPDRHPPRRISEMSET